MINFGITLGRLWVVDVHSDKFGANMFVSSRDACHRFVDDHSDRDSFWATLRQLFDNFDTNMFVSLRDVSHRFVDAHSDNFCYLTL